LTSLVLPGLLEVIASFLLRQSIFMREDLPTFDLPMKANSGNFCFGFSDILVLLPANNASLIFIFCKVTRISRQRYGFLFYFIRNNGGGIGNFAKFVAKELKMYGKGIYRPV
jgi:hypothetical protein